MKYGFYTLGFGINGKLLSSPLRGLRTSSPLQFGQTHCIFSVHSGQNVHS
jgi:hypothetical protein